MILSTSFGIRLWTCASAYWFSELCACMLLFTLYWGNIETFAVPVFCVRVWRSYFNLLDAMRHFCGFASPPRWTTCVALTHIPLQVLKMQMRELYDQSEYLLWFSPCFFHSSRRRKLFQNRFLQGESFAESGPIISHYFRTYFSLYVVPRGLTVQVPGFW